MLYQDLLDWIKNSTTVLQPMQHFILHDSITCCFFGVPHMLGTAVPSAHYNFQLAYNIIKCQSKLIEQNLISNPASGTIPEDCFSE